MSQLGGSAERTQALDPALRHTLHLREPSQGLRGEQQLPAVDRVHEQQQRQEGHHDARERGRPVHILPVGWSGNGEERRGMQHV